MPIVLSTHIVGHAQANGMHYVEEAHTDHMGNVYRVEYGPVGDVDYVAIRTARAAMIEQQLADQEAEALLGA